MRVGSLPCGSQKQTHWVLVQREDFCDTLKVKPQMKFETVTARLIVVLRGVLFLSIFSEAEGLFQCLQSSSFKIIIDTLHTYQTH